MERDTDIIPKEETFRGENIIVIALNRWLSHGKEWAAKVVGLDFLYGLDLKFCPVVERNWSRSGRDGTTKVKLLGTGYYRISNPRRGRYGREAIGYYYFDEEKLEMRSVTENEVYLYFKNKEKENKSNTQKDENQNQSQVNSSKKLRLA